EELNLFRTALTKRINANPVAFISEWNEDKKRKDLFSALALLADWKAVFVNLSFTQMEVLLTAAPGLLRTSNNTFTWYQEAFLHRLTELVRERDMDDRTFRLCIAALNPTSSVSPSSQSLTALVLSRLRHSGSTQQLYEFLSDIR